MPEPLDQPLGVVALDELTDDRARLGQRRELVQVEALLLQRPHESFRDAVALRLADVGRRDRDAEPFPLVDPGVGDVLRPPITPQAQAARDLLAEGAEGVPHALADWLQRGPAIADLGRVPAHDLVDRVIDGPEEPAPAVLLGVEAGRVRAPHLVRLSAATPY